MTTAERKEIIRAHMRKLGRKGGRVMSSEKLAALKLNAQRPRPRKKKIENNG